MSRQSLAFRILEILFFIFPEKMPTRVTLLRLITQDQTMVHFIHRSLQIADLSPHSLSSSSSSSSSKKYLPNEAFGEKRSELNCWLLLLFFKYFLTSPLLLSFQVHNCSAKFYLWNSAGKTNGMQVELPVEKE